MRSSLVRQLSGALALLVIGAVGERWLPAEPARAAKVFSDMERLTAEDDIRQTIALYGLLADGDGIAPRDFPELGNRVFAKDAISEVRGADGRLIKRTVGRDTLVADALKQDFSGPSTGRHYLVSTVFDSLTATAARTRTTALYVRAAKAPVGQVEKAAMFVYHDEWNRTSQGWRKTRTTLYGS